MSLPQSIFECETRLRALRGSNNREYGPASVLYLISRVGTDETARRYVEALANDKDIGSAVYVTPADLGLAAKRTVFLNSENDAAYTRLVSRNLHCH